jgi:glycosyltransferase involved in cell wall biosynthesis
MKIGISTSVIQRGKTGIAQYLFALIRAWVPHAFVLEEDRPLFDFAQSAMELVSIAERHRPPARNILWHQTHLPAMAREKKLDVLHIPSYRRLPWPQPCATVATIHDLAPFHVAHKYDWKRMFYGRVVVRRLARRLQEIIAVSHNTARDITRFFGLPAERLTVIHNGLDHERFFPLPPAGAKAWAGANLGLDQPFFLYVARLEHPGKNHVRLITAFNRFKTETRSLWQLALAGSDWTHADVIHRQIAQSPWAQDIRCLGFVDDEKLPMLYRAADGFVYPSLYEGFGMPPLEAMACGCPVLCSTRGSLGEIVGRAALTVSPEDVHALQESLADLAANTQLRQCLRAKGLQHAQRFSWQQTAQATLDTFERAAFGHQATAAKGAVRSLPDALRCKPEIPAWKGRAPGGA